MRATDRTPSNFRHGITTSSEMQHRPDAHQLGQLDVRLTMKQRATCPHVLFTTLCCLSLVIVQHMLSHFSGCNRLQRLDLVQPRQASAYTTHKQEADCFDLLIPYHPSDQAVFIQQGGLHSIQRHVQGWRTTFIIAADNSTLVDVLGTDQTIWLPEARFQLNHTAKLRGWFRQQAFKLLAPLQVPEMCNTFLVLDADLYFVRDWSPRGAHNSTFKYLLPNTFGGGHQRDLGARAQAATFYTLRLNSLTSPGTLCTVHHHMVMQQDVIHAMLGHIHGLHGLTLMELLVKLQKHLNWWSEYDAYISFMFHHFRGRMQFVDFPYLHAREASRCTEADAASMRAETDVVFMGCHDHYQGHDICSGSRNNCTSSVSFCKRMIGTLTDVCMAHDSESVPCPICALL